METKLVNIKSGGRYTLYIGRANRVLGHKESKWANKYVIGRDGTREECIEKYKQDLIRNDKLMDDLHEIDNQILGCYCYPNNHCHGEVLIDLREKQKAFELQTGGIEHLHKPIKKYRIGIIGSRDYNDFNSIYKYLDSKFDKIGHLVSGGCPTGADRACEIYAKDKGFSITIHYPDWKTYGKKAAFIRNKKIAEDCDILIAWHSNNSAGTQNTIEIAQKLGKKVIIHKV